MCVFSSFIGTISATVNSLRNAQGQKLKQEENLLRFFIERTGARTHVGGCSVAFLFAVIWLPGQNVAPGKNLGF